MEQAGAEKAIRLAGRYLLLDSIGTGGMARVQLARLRGPAGFSKPVAIKRLHEHLADDPEFVEMFLDEARLAARVRHPNVVSTLDVVQEGNEVFLVLDYVEGEPLGRLLRHARKQDVAIPAGVLSAMIGDALHGLHAAHTARSDQGEALGIVHRDVSPQNILVGLDGVSRMLDFGIAKGAGRIQTTRDGRLKGKIRYMAPEHVEGHAIDARADVYGMGVVLWEALVGRQLIDGDNEVANISRVLEGCFEPPSKHAPDAAPFDEVVLRALEGSPDKRFDSALEMAKALSGAVPPAPSYVVAEWVQLVAGAQLEERARRFRALEAQVVASEAEEPEAATSSSMTPPAAALPVPARDERGSGRGGLLAVVAALVTFGALGALGWLVVWPALQGGDAALPAAVDRDSRPANQPSAAAATVPALPAPSTAEQEEVLDLDAFAAQQASGAPAAPAGARSAPSDPLPSASARAARTASTSRVPAERARDAEKSGTEAGEAQGDAPPDKPAPDCSNPFFVDAEGIKHVRSECQ